MRLRGTAFTTSQALASWALVVSLLMRGGPSAIVRRVRTVVVDAINRVTMWTWSHVAEESREVVTPLIANGDAPSTIPRIRSTAGPVAARLHRPPDSVQPCAFSSRLWFARGFGSSFRYLAFFVGEAAATTRVVIAQARSCGHALVAAIAAASPSVHSVTTRMANPFQDDEMSKSLAGNVSEQGMGRPGDWSRILAGHVGLLRRLIGLGRGGRLPRSLRPLLALSFYLIAISATPVFAQGSLDAEKVYFWSGGTSRMNLSTGSGAPSGGTNGNVYVDYTNHEVYIKHAGTWSLIPRVDTLNTFTPGLVLSYTAPSLLFYESDQAADLRYWRAYADGQQFFLQSLTDAFGLSATVLSSTRDGDVTIPSGDLTIGSHILPSVNFTSNAGSIDKKFLRFYGSELQVGTLVAASTMATVGGRVLVAPTSYLTADKAPIIASPGTPTVTPQGVSGATTYSYKITALDGEGETISSNAGQTTTGNATLSASNFNRLTWSAVTGATRYHVYGRTSGAWTIIAATTSATYDDVGSGPFGVAPPSAGFSTFYVKSNILAAADQPYMESSGKVEFLLVDQWVIGAVNTGAKQFLITGDYAGVFTAGRTFVVTGSPANDGTYTVSTSSTSNIATTITVVETIPSGVAGGGVQYVSTGSAYAYKMYRDRDGTGTNQWYAGDALLNTGTTGDGLIDLFSDTGVVSGTGPSIVGNVRTSTTYNAISPRWTIGNLNGSYNYVATTYGACFGDASATNVCIDATNGFRIRSATTNKFVADTSGNLSLTGDLAMSTSGVFRAGATAFGTGTGWWLDYNGGTPRFRIGNPSGNRVEWDGTNLALVSANTTIDSSGIAITPSTSGTYGATTAYNFTVANGTLGMYGFDNSGSGLRGLLINAEVNSGSYSIASIAFNVNNNVSGSGQFTMSSSNVIGTTRFQVSFADILLGGKTTVTTNGFLVGNPTGGDKGTGSINVAADIYKNNTAYTNPKWALQHYFTGTADHAGPYEMPKWYRGLMPLDAHRAFVQRHFDLPLMLEEQGAGMFRRGDLLLASVEEAYLYIYQLNDRIKALEAALGRTR